MSDTWQLGSLSFPLALGRGVKAICAKTGIRQSDWIGLTLKAALDRELGDWPYWREQSLDLVDLMQNRRKIPLSVQQANKRRLDRDAKRIQRGSKLVPRCPSCAQPMRLQRGKHVCQACGKQALLADPSPNL